MPTLLWADDDGAGRYMYEEECLTETGWTVEWAHSTEEAIRKLAEHPFDALLLDQMMPLAEHDTDSAVEVWGGCVVLWWLRRGKVPGDAPLSVHEVSKPFASLTPHAQNNGLPVIVVSAFDDEQVTALIESAGEPPTRLLPKPIEFTDVEDELQRLGARGSDAG